MSFARIAEQARAKGTSSIRRLKRELGMGEYGSACRSFIEQALKTGQTVFTEEDDNADA